MYLINNDEINPKNKLKKIATEEKCQEMNITMGVKSR